jgi:hypothetical protein
MNRRLKKTPDDVLLASLGALAIAEQEGDEFFQELVKKGRELRESTARDSGSSATELRAAIEVVLAAFEELSVSQRIWSNRSSLLKSAMLPEVSDEEIARRQAARNAAAREELVSEFGFVDLDEDQLKDWQEQGRIFPVEHQGRLRFPAFQFNAEGQPLPVIAQVLSTLGRQTTGWGLALWFTSSNGWFDDRRAVDLLLDKPEEVAEAAEREAEGLFF